MAVTDQSQQDMYGEETDNLPSENADFGREPWLIAELGDDVRFKKTADYVISYSLIRDRLVD